MTVRERATPTVMIRKVEAAELDEMWSFVDRKQHPRWLWGALEHQTGRMMASVFGRREDQALPALKALLAPLGIRCFYTDGWVPITDTWPHTSMWSVNEGRNR